MKPANRAMLPVLVCLTLAISACNLGSSAQTPAAASPAVQEPGAATVTPVTLDPTSTPSAPADQELSESEIAQIIRSSLAAYPWRLTQTVLLKESGQTSTSIMEAQSGVRGYTRSEETMGGAPFTVESMRIDSAVYVKMTGAGMAEQYGLVEGQWAEVLPDSLLLLRLAEGAREPGQMAETFITEFAEIRGHIGANDELLFTLVGSEEVNAVSTNIYEITAAGFIDRWWIGADGRFYKSTVDYPEATRTITIEYDPGITVQPPTP